ncbi:hypothetical protein T08_10961 [Trichinella sp. T8]|nr:hypothetical protein T08_10961 [Trichinella sp. T8]
MAPQQCSPAVLTVSRISENKVTVLQSSKEDSADTASEIAAIEIEFEHILKNPLSVSSRNMLRVTVIERQQRKFIFNNASPFQQQLTQVKKIAFVKVLSSRILLAQILRDHSTWGTEPHVGELYSNQLAQLVKSTRRNGRSLTLVERLILLSALSRSCGQGFATSIASRRKKQIIKLSSTLPLVDVPLDTSSKGGNGPGHGEGRR